MTAYTFDENLYSDLFKDAHGFRPRGDEFYSASDDRKQAIWDGLLVDLEYAVNAEKRQKEAAVKAFADRIQEVISLGAADEEVALRWILEAENFSLNDYQYGADYIAYHFDLPYGNQWRNQLDKLTHQKVSELYQDAA